MPAKNLYAVLGVDEKAGPEELRRAWLRLAVKFHPDRNPGNPKAEERFKEISQAYALLSDPAARARYERTRPKPDKPKTEAPKADSPDGPRTTPKPEPSKPEAQGPAAGPKAEAKPAEPKPGPEDPKVENPSDWTEILNTFFHTPKGRDTLKELEEELRRAGLKISSAPKRARTWLAGLRKVFDPAWLPGGQDRTRAARYDIGYDLALSPEAAAKGTTVEISYPRDDGRRQELKISLPAGLSNGARLRLPDQGRPRPDGGRGDLVLNIIKAPMTP